MCRDEFAYAVADASRRGYPPALPKPGESVGYRKNGRLRDAGARQTFRLQRIITAVECLDEIDTLRRQDLRAAIQFGAKHSEALIKPLRHPDFSCAPPRRHEDAGRWRG